MIEVFLLKTFFLKITINIKWKKMIYFIKYIEEIIVEFMTKKDYDLRVSKILKEGYYVENVSDKLWLLLMDYSKTFNVSVIKAIEELQLQVVEPLLEDLLKDYYRLKKLERILND